VVVDPLDTAVFIRSDPTLRKEGPFFHERAVLPVSSHHLLLAMRGLRITFLLACFLMSGFAARAVVAQNADLSFLLTAAERTHFDETTRYDEVMAFIDVAAAQHPDLHVSHFGYSVEGRRLPLVVFGKVPDATPESIMRSDKMRIFVQANIHAGEVCGKEALLMLIRSLASGEHAAWADSVVLMMAPIYNADGNERVNLYNRPRQNGPYGGMGQRPNAQGLDLNRDHMKARSPEAQSLIGLMNAYDPHVLVDLHTTNGTRHGYHLTYSSPLNPNTDGAIDSLLREEMLPAVRSELQERTGWDSYWYGNLPFRRGEAGWYTFDHRPRFNNNYIGLRNRLAILSEAYAYASFEERILSSLHFVEAIVDYSIQNAGTIRDAIAEAEVRSQPGLEQGLRFESLRNAASTAIRMGTVEERINPYSGAPFFSRLDSTYFQEMPEYGAFSAIESSTIPDRYVVLSDAAADVSDLLRRHGIAYSRVQEAGQQHVESFVVDSTRAAERAFQGVNERTVWGHWVSSDTEIPAGSLVVPTDANQARLVFYLLEPRSDDGMVNWGLLEDWVEPGATYPILRSLSKN